MKKFLSVALALAMLVSCFALLSFAAEETNAPTNVVYDFNEGVDGNVFGAHFAGTVEYVADGGVNGSGAAKFTGDKTDLGGYYGSWYAPGLTNTESKKIITEAGEYVISFDIYFEDLGFAQQMSFCSRGRAHVPYWYAEDIKAGEWLHYEFIIDIAAEDLAHDGFSLMFDNIGTTTARIDNLAVKRNVYMGQAVNGLYNGNAEDGIFYFEGLNTAPASFVQVEGGANGTAHAIKVNGTSQWSSVAYRLDTAITGDGDYAFSFYMKADAATTMRMYFNSQWHKDVVNNKADFDALGWSEDAHKENTFFRIGDDISVGTDWAQYTVEFTVTEDYYNMIQKIAEVHPDAAKLVLRFENLGTIGTYYIDEIERIVDPMENALKVVNGDLELGNLTGWDKSFIASPGATTTLVQPGANGTANAAKVDIAGKWDTVTFDLGPAIIQDADLNYYGAGAGIYTIKFWAKAEAGEEGSYLLLLNSNNHVSASQAAERLPEGQKELATMDSYITVANSMFTLTDEWEQYSIEFEITEEYLALIKALRHSDVTENYYKNNTYELLMRFDGSPADCAYGAGDTFSYFVDEVVIEAPKADAEKEEPTAVTFTAKADVEAAAGMFIITKNGVVSAADVKDGMLVKSFTFKNESDVDLKIALSLQTVATKEDGTPTWAGPQNSIAIDIAPGAEETLEYECEVNDGKIEVLGKEYALETFFYRLDVSVDGSSSFIPEGTSFTIFAEGADNAAFKAPNNMAGSGSWDITVRTNYTATGDFAPVAMIAIVAIAAVALVAVVVRKKKED